MCIVFNGIMYIFVCSHEHVFNSTHIGGYLELSYSVKIPMSLLKSHSSFRRYKYCVDSVATRAGIVNSVEFISGPTTKRGDVIDRCLKLHVSIQQGCKHFCL